MPGSGSLIEKFFLNKPECVIDLPEALLPSDKIRKYQGMSHLAIVEVAGRDATEGDMAGKRGEYNLRGAVTDASRKRYRENIEPAQYRAASANTGYSAAC